jgi:hypothetical protein
MLKIFLIVAQRLLALVALAPQMAGCARTNTENFQHAKILAKSENFPFGKSKIEKIETF